MTSFIILRLHAKAGTCMGVREGCCGIEITNSISPGN